MMDWNEKAAIFVPEGKGCVADSKANHWKDESPTVNASSPNQNSEKPTSAITTSRENSWKLSHPPIHRERSQLAPPQLPARQTAATNKITKIDGSCASEPSIKVLKPMALMKERRVAKNAFEASLIISDE